MARYSIKYLDQQGNEGTIVLESDSRELIYDQVMARRAHVLKLELAPADSVPGRIEDIPYNPDFSDLIDLSRLEELRLRLVKGDDDAHGELLRLLEQYLSVLQAHTTEKSEDAAGPYWSQVGMLYDNVEGMTPKEARSCLRLMDKEAAQQRKRRTEDPWDAWDASVDLGPFITLIGRRKRSTRYVHANLLLSPDQVTITETDHKDYRFSKAFDPSEITVFGLSLDESCITICSKLGDTWKIEFDKERIPADVLNRLRAADLRSGGIFRTNVNKDRWKHNRREVKFVVVNALRYASKEFFPIGLLSATWGIVVFWYLTAFRETPFGDWLWSLPTLLNMLLHMTVLGIPWDIWYFTRKARSGGLPPAIDTCLMIFPFSGIVTLFSLFPFVLLYLLLEWLLGLI